MARQNIEPESNAGAQPNGCRSFRFVGDRRNPPEGWLYVRDLDNRLWVQGVSATHIQEWTLRVDPVRAKGGR
jgi:hypothetical protein